jgi:cytochrome c556
MKLRIPMGLAVAALVAGLLVGAGSAAPVSGTDPIGATARALLKSRMAHHAKAMFGLSGMTESVVMLNYDGASVEANRLLDQPFWTDPGVAGPDDINTQLPAAFFADQAQLRTAAREVATAAGARDPTALAKAFGRLTASCVACHRAYLPPPTTP